MASIDNADGFTLLETLIGFLILSLALGISAETIALASKSLSVAKERRDVMHAADALLAMEATQPVEVVLKSNGRMGTLTWTRRGVPVATGERAKDGADFSVLTIKSISGREYRYLSFRIGAR